MKKMSNDLRSVSIEWKEHPIFTNYLVQNGGYVKNKKSGKILKTRYDKAGRERVNLYQNGVYRTVYIYRLVAETFIPNPNNYNTIHHIDHDKTNNCWYNLEWCDFSTNLLYEKKGLY